MLHVRLGGPHMSTILITGTSSGLGLGTAVELASRGHRVFATMRDISRSAALRTALSAREVAATILPLDVCDEDSVAAAVGSVLHQAGRIDVLLNNAGVTVVGPLETSTDREVHNVFNTNVFGALRTTRAVLPSMRAHGAGRIVNVSSVAAHSRVGIRLWGVYAASKAALHTLTMELVKELAPLGLEVVLVEGGVAGQTEVWTAVRRSVREWPSEDEAYGFSERLAAIQLAAVMSGPDQTRPTVQMVADACVVPNPGVRYPSASQTGLDACDRISDETFARLAAGEKSPELYDSLPGFWALQK